MAMDRYQELLSELIQKSRKISLIDLRAPFNDEQIASLAGEVMATVVLLSDEGFLKPESIVAAIGKSLTKARKPRKRAAAKPSPVSP